MSIETRDEYFARIRDAEKPHCPHCEQQMQIWETPPVSFGDGLGWGAPYLFLCLNDECPVYVQNWEAMEANYGHTASCRCFRYLDGENYEYMPVFSPVGSKGQVIDEQRMMEEEMLRRSMREGFSILADCYVDRDGVGVMKILTDSTQAGRVRLKAAEMIGDIGEAEAVGVLRDLSFSSRVIQEEVNKAVEKLHQRHFTRECPFCGEIIKQRARLCKACKKEIAGR